MQSQEHNYYDHAQTPPVERTINNDPNEQQPSATPSPPYEERSYADGYTGRESDDYLNHYAQDNWFQEGEKLQPQKKEQRGPGTIILVLVALCVGIALGHGFGLLMSWLTWTTISILVVLAAFAIISNWHVVTFPIPEQTFSIQEHARLEINNASGNVTIRRGEQNVVTIAATKRASGPWITAENMQINYNQRGDMISAISNIHWSPLQFGFRNIDLEITIPQNSDIQLKTGAGKIDVQDINGALQLRTGSGSINARALQGQITFVTGSGRVDVAQLDGRIEIKTGSGSMNADQLTGDITLRTGSGPITAGAITGNTHLRTGSGGIHLNAVSGSAQVVTGSGGIHMTQTNLAGNSTIRTGSGGIDLDGSLDPRGTYHMQTGSGSIRMLLNNQEAIELQAQTGSGKVVNDFASKGADAAGPRAQVTAKTGSGSITLQRGM